MSVALVALKFLTILLFSVNHPCVINNRCSHLCFVNQGEAVCSCPSDKILGENKRTCECKETFFFQYMQSFVLLLC